LVAIVLHPAINFESKVSCWYHLSFNRSPLLTTSIFQILFISFPTAKDPQQSNRISRNVNSCLNTLPNFFFRQNLLKTLLRNHVPQYKTTSSKHLNLSSLNLSTGPQASDLKAKNRVLSKPSEIVIGIPSRVVFPMNFVCSRNRI
jgi:hypothetical protein